MYIRRQLQHAYLPYHPNTSKLTVPPLLVIRIYPYPSAISYKTSPFRSGLILVFSEGHMIQRMIQFHDGFEYASVLLRIQDDDLRKVIKGIDQSHDYSCGGRSFYTIKPIGFLCSSRY